MKSFKIDHDKLTPGIYKHSVSGLVTTWDIRMKIPNNEKDDYLTPEIIHTIEHTLASYMRYRYGDYRIVGIFPMGCQTGFYVLTRFIDRKMIYDAILDYIDCLERMIAIPGATRKECGNYKLQDMVGAKKEMKKYLLWLSHQNAAMDYIN